MDDVITPDEVLATPRLSLRRLLEDDAPFLVELLNDPAWLRYIGDKNVRTDEDARNYIRTGPWAMYRRVGHGNYLVRLKAGGQPIGMCGLLKRDALPDADLGFAFLPAYRRQGYAYEAARGVLGYARAVLGIGRIVAITTPDNRASAQLLEKLGFGFAGMTRMAEGAEELRLFANPAPAT
ncbi:MAG TPA: GNAT family N-acetyltransferase [Solimonas sp.]|nr:GNAT family N-acetyltransferase [Solimonas sp.]